MKKTFIIFMIFKHTKVYIEKHNAFIKNYIEVKTSISGSHSNLTNISETIAFKVKS